MRPIILCKKFRNRRVYLKRSFGENGKTEYHIRTKRLVRDSVTRRGEIFQTDLRLTNEAMFAIAQMWAELANVRVVKK